MTVEAVIFQETPSRRGWGNALLREPEGTWSVIGVDDATRARWDLWISEHTTVIAIGPAARVRRYGRICAGAHRNAPAPVGVVFDTLAGHLRGPLDSSDLFTAVSLCDMTLSELAAPAVVITTREGRRVWADVALGANATIAEGDADALVVTPDGELGADLDDGLVTFDRAIRDPEGQWVLWRGPVAVGPAGEDLSAVLSHLCREGELSVERTSVRRAFSDISDTLRAAARVAESWSAPVALRGAWVDRRGAANAP